MGAMSESSSCSTKASYFNRKLFPSIVLQGVCDANNKFLDIYVGNVGSVHDALVLRSPHVQGKPVPTARLFPPWRWWISMYPAPITIVTLTVSQLPVEARFNRHHAKARNVIERTFGALKTRWRAIFLRALEIRPTFAPKVVGACCLLHNLCVDADDLLEVNEAEEDGRDAEEEDPAAEGRELSGSGLRATLSAEVSAPQVLAACLVEHDYI
ncbi:hypothetical protein WMY93_008718 [Mugilogobius chulae]|uniref:DDE Tnp4 domain-containing protein n=1 Tax=Mugilogobius chulae TaxID=88201 RepID=A0AAW0PAQ7_9GOBI